MHPMIIGFLSLTKEVRAEEFTKMIQKAGNFIVDKSANELANMMLFLSSMVAVLPEDEPYPEYLKTTLIGHVSYIIKETGDTDLANALKAAFDILQLQLKKHDAVKVGE